MAVSHFQKGMVMQGSSAERDSAACLCRIEGSGACAMRRCCEAVISRRGRRRNLTEAVRFHGAGTLPQKRLCMLVFGKLV